VGLLLENGADVNSRNYCGQVKKKTFFFMGFNLIYLFLFGGFDIYACGNVGMICWIDFGNGFFFLGSCGETFGFGFFLVL